MEFEYILSIFLIKKKNIFFFRIRRSYNKGCPYLCSILIYFMHKFDNFSKRYSDKQI